jgi:beta-glucosidase/6-phospho-beta-glucosidase/beta-galactosidase
MRLSPSLALCGAAAAASAAAAPGTAATAASAATAAAPVCLGYDECPPFPAPYAGPGPYPTAYNYSGAFPDGFLWGLGTAAYQIEGAYNEGGRGASIWDTFTGANTVGMVGSNCSAAPCPINGGQFAKGATGNVANDHYHRFAEDVQMMRGMGLKHYRFSIAWPRLLPNGTLAGGINHDGVAFYNELIDALIANGITPAVTLYHWDLPQALLVDGDPERQGWFSVDAATGAPNGDTTIGWHFADYAELCFRTFGDRVKMWLTFNEAWTFTWLGSGAGKAPGLASYPMGDDARWPLVAGHNVLLAHGLAVQRYRALFQPAQGGQIGITNNCDWREPLDGDPLNVGAAARAVEFWLGWMADPIYGGRGDYPDSMRRVLGDRLPSFSAAQRAMLKGSADFFGLNHYGTGWVANNAADPGFGQAYGDVTEAGFERAQSVWLYSAGWGLRKLLNWVARRYRNPPTYVTESGWSLAAASATAGVADGGRLLYYANYTSEMQRAIALDGVDVRGYFAWSLMDNFEWERGYLERFGVVFNDFGMGHDPNAPADQDHQPTTDQKRTPKDSLNWMKAVWAANAIVDPTPFLPNATAAAATTTTARLR